MTHSTASGSAAPTPDLAPETRYLAPLTFYALLEEDPVEEQSGAEWGDSPYFDEEKGPLGKDGVMPGGFHAEVALWRVPGPDDKNPPGALRVLRSWKPDERAALSFVPGTQGKKVAFPADRREDFPPDGLPADHLPVLLLVREWGEADRDHLAFVRLHSPCGLCSDWFQLARAGLEFLDDQGRPLRDLPRSQPVPAIAADLDRQQIPPDLVVDGRIPLGLTQITVTDHVPLRAIYLNGRKFPLARAEGEADKDKNYNSPHVTFSVVGDVPDGAVPRTVSVQRTLAPDGTYTYRFEHVDVDPSSLGSPRVEILAENLLGARAQAVAVYVPSYGANGKVRHYHTDRLSLHSDHHLEIPAAVRLRYRPVPYLQDKLAEEKGSRANAGKARFYATVHLQAANDRPVPVRVYRQDTVKAPYARPSATQPFVPANDQEDSEHTRRRTSPDQEPAVSPITFASTPPAWEMLSDPIVLTAPLPRALPAETANTSAGTPSKNPPELADEAKHTFLPASLGALVQAWDLLPAFTPPANASGTDAMPPAPRLAPRDPDSPTGKIVGTLWVREESDTLHLCSAPALAAGVEPVAHATFQPLTAAKNGDLLRLRAYTLRSERNTAIEPDEPLQPDALTTYGAPEEFACTLNDRTSKDPPRLDAFLRNVGSHGVFDTRQRDEIDVPTNTDVQLDLVKAPDDTDTAAASAYSSSQNASPPLRSRVTRCYLSCHVVRLLTQEYLQTPDKTRLATTLQNEYKDIQWLLARGKTAPRDILQNQQILPWGHLYYETPDPDQSSSGSSAESAGSSGTVLHVPALRALCPTLEITTRWYLDGRPSLPPAAAGTTPRVGAPGTHRVAGLNQVLRDGSVYVHNGELYQAAEDLHIPGRIQDLTLRRVHRSHSLFTSALGRNWDWIGNMRLVEMTNGDVYLMNGDAGIERYAASAPARDALKAKDVHALTKGNFNYATLHGNSQFTSPKGVYRSLLKAHPVPLGPNDQQADTDKASANATPAANPKVARGHVPASARHAPPPSPDSEGPRFYLAGKHGTVWTFTKDPRFHTPLPPASAPPCADHQPPPGLAGHYLLTAVHDRRQASALRLQRDQHGLVRALIDDNGRVTTVDYENADIAADRFVSRLTDFAGRCVGIGRADRDLTSVAGPTVRIAYQTSDTEEPRYTYQYAPKPDHGPRHRLQSVTVPHASRDPILSLLQRDGQGRTESLATLNSNRYAFVYLPNATEYRTIYLAPGGPGRARHRSDLEVFYFDKTGSKDFPRVGKHVVHITPHASSGHLGGYVKAAPTAYTYNDDGEVEVITYPKKNTEQFVYGGGSQAGNLAIRCTRTPGGVATSSTAYKNYCPAFNLPGRIEQQGYVADGGAVPYSTVNEYDDAGNLTCTFRDIKDPKKETYKYTCPDQLLAESGTVTGATTTYDYYRGEGDARNVPGNANQCSGKVKRAETAFTTVTALNAKSGTRRYTTTYGWDLRGYPTRTTGPDNVPYKPTFNELGQLLRDHTGETYDYSFGRVCRKRTPLPNGSTAVVTMQYDALGNVVETVVGTNTNIATKTEYDIHGNPVHETAPSGVETFQIYDERGLLIERVVTGNG